VLRPSECSHAGGTRCAREWGIGRRSSRGRCFSRGVPQVGPQAELEEPSWQAEWPAAQDGEEGARPREGDAGWEKGLSTAQDPGIVARVMSWWHLRGRSERTGRSRAAGLEERSGAPPRLERALRCARGWSGVPRRAARGARWRSV
jgi:hypothetical protein